MVEFLAEHLAHFAYPGVFTILFLCGVALPLPEEPVLIAAGFLCYKGNANVWIMIVVAMAGIMGGDLTIHWIGRKHGDWVFRSRLLRFVLPEDRLEKAAAFFAKHGAKAVFFGRFIAGIRFVTFFTAGKFGVRRSVFFLFDFLAALLTIPISIWAGWRFGHKIEEGLAWATRYHRIAIGTAIGGFILYLLIRKLSRHLSSTWRRRREAAAGAGLPAPSAPPTPIQATADATRDA